MEPTNLQRQRPSRQGVARLFGEPWTRKSIQNKLSRWTESEKITNDVVINPFTVGLCFKPFPDASRLTVWPYEKPSRQLYWLCACVKHCLWREKPTKIVFVKRKVYAFSLRNKTMPSPLQLDTVQCLFSLNYCILTFFYPWWDKNVNYCKQFIYSSWIPGFN